MVKYVGENEETLHTLKIPKDLYVLFQKPDICNIIKGEALEVREFC